jgi:hypothetical protein
MLKGTNVTARKTTSEAVLLLPLLLFASLGNGGRAEDLPSSCSYPTNCPHKVLPRGDTQTWRMNESTIIMPCNNSGFTSPASTLDWAISSFDWSNAKGTGSAPGWAKHSPMDDEEMLFEQVKMTTAATPGTTVWVYRCSVYAYPWYTSVRKLLDDDAYAPWFIDFKPQGPWFSPKCDQNFDPPKCSDHFHMQEQSPGYPHGDGDCKAPGCDCGVAPCGFYLWNHSSTAIVHGQSFREWFIHSYMLNEVGMSPLVSGFFWDDFWPKPGGVFPDASAGRVANDTGLDVDLGDWAKITDSYHANMDALRARTLSVGKFAWQLMWTGGSDTSVGGTVPSPIVQQATCAATLRRLCNETAPPQTRAMMFTLNTPLGDPSKLLSLKQDLANFLLIRGPFAWLGHAWKGCSKDYPFPPEFHLDYGTPVDSICAETSDGSGVFAREWSNVRVQLDCNTWEPTFTWKNLN